MKANGDKSLKAQNMKWLIAMAFADAAIVLLFVAPEITNRETQYVAMLRGLATSVVPVLILLVVNVLPHDVKSMLVYWKPLGWLPGSEAFSKFGPRDPRIDVKVLQKNVGVFPTDPTEQNSKWYRLYKMVGDQPEVVEAHKMYLMYRDMAVLSLPLIVLLPLGLFYAEARASALWISAGLLVVQYLLTAFSGRWAGIRFVANVLAIHSAKKIKEPPAKAPAA